MSRSRLGTSIAMVAGLALATVCLCACGSTMVTSKSTTSTIESAGTNQSTSTVTSKTTPTSTVTSTSAASPNRPSMWDRPALVHPQTITISPSNYNLKLSQVQDFILRCPKGRVTLPSKLVVWGGHNVLLENCDLHITDQDWVSYLQHQTGTLWIHDVHFGGGHLTGGIQMQEPGATVVMRDVLFDKVYGSLHTNHAELIQTWCGPKRLLIDGLSGSTTYQGLFLLPNQWCPTRLSQFDLRHVDIDDSGGAVALWLGDVKGGNSALRLNVRDVYVNPPSKRRWRGWWLQPQPPSQTWAGAIAGAPPGGSYVKPSSRGAVGVDEVSAPAALATEQIQ